MSDQTKSAVALALRSRVSENQSQNRDLKKGLSRHTEHYAYGHVIPLAGDRSREQRLLRLAGLVASSSVPQGDQSFGEWLRAKETKSVEGRLLRLMSLDFEQAVSEISRLLRLVDDKGSFNWFQLADNLFFWGKGITDNSLDARQRILKDYYRVAPKLLVEDDEQAKIDSESTDGKSDSE